MDEIFNTIKREWPDAKWTQRILAAQEAGHFTSNDKMHARSWETCAVGSNPYVLRSDILDNPIGKSIHWFSMEFYKYVTDGNVERAAEAYYDIMMRCKNLHGGTHIHG